VAARRTAPPVRASRSPAGGRRRARRRPPPARCARAGARAPASRSEKSQAVDELAAAEPRQPATLDDLDVSGRRVVLDVLLAVLQEPVADIVFGVELRNALAVDEERVPRHQRPAAAYAGDPSSASAACAAASRASGTRN